MRSDAQDATGALSGPFGRALMFDRRFAFASPSNIDFWDFGVIRVRGLITDRVVLIASRCLRNIRHCEARKSGRKDIR